MSEGQEGGQKYSEISGQSAGCCYCLSCSGNLKRGSFGGDLRVCCYLRSDSLLNALNWVVYLRLICCQANCLNSWWFWKLNWKQSSFHCPQFHGHLHALRSSAAANKDWKSSGSSQCSNCECSAQSPARQQECPGRHGSSWCFITYYHWSWHCLFAEVLCFDMSSKEAFGSCGSLGRWRNWGQGFGSLRCSRFVIKIFGIISHII